MTRAGQWASVGPGGAPVLLASLAIIRVALGAGRVVGVPIPWVPDLPGVEELSPGMSQSAEDGTMPLLQCCIGTAHSGEFIEPSKGMWGVPAVVAKRSAKEIDPAAPKLIWEMSEKACGEWKL